MSATEMESAQKAMQPKRRGRPPKPRPSTDGESMDAAPPKPRGRPPKARPYDASTEAAPAPKPRGRPPKARPAADDASMEASPAPKPRGRPPKSSTDGAQPKPRGRPRKVQPELIDDKSMASAPIDDKSMSPVSAQASPSPTRPSPSKTSSPDGDLVSAMAPLSLKRKGGPDLATESPSQKRGRIGRVLVFGSGECAQLGLTEDRTERKFPTPVELNDRIVAVACGGLHNIALTDDGQVWTWGCNDEKALGRGGDEWVPGKVDVPVRVRKATAGDSHSMVLGDNGRVYTWGAYRDTNGLMGFNPNAGEPCAVPIPVYLHGKTAIDIASGVNHSLVLLENGEIFEWGHIRIGQRVARHHRMDLLEPRLVNVRNFGRVTRIWAGAYQSFALTQAGRVYAFGMNQYGQAGVGGDSKRKQQLHKPEEVVALRGLDVVKISGGLHHSLALLADGRVLSFGRNNYGELGMGDIEERRVPTFVPNLSDVVDIACGSTHSLAVTKSGDAYSCGFGEMLQLGNGEAEDRNRFEKVGGQQLENGDVIACAAGAQHSVLVLAPRLSSS